MTKEMSVDDANNDGSVVNGGDLQQQASEEDINSHANRWDQTFSRLQAYKIKHGHVNVPNRYKADPSLGSWVSAQRRQYKIVTSGQNGSTAMTIERAKKLVDIGFKWSTSNPHHVSWETRYQELKEFVAKYGHAQVPMRWQENEALSNWVSKQRQDIKLLDSGHSSRLSPERLNWLNEVGFVWEVDRATSRQLKGAVLKTNGAQGHASFTSSEAVSLRQAQHNIVAEQTAISDDLQNETIPASGAFSIVTKRRNSDLTGTKSDKSSPSALLTAAARQVSDHNDSDSKARPETKAAASTYAEEPPGFPVIHRQATKRSAEAPSIISSEEAEDSPPPSRASHLGLPTKRLRSAMAQRKETVS